MGEPTESEMETALNYAKRLADTGAIGERQAQVYVLREVQGLDRNLAADVLGISPNTVDNHLEAARTNVEQARALVKLLNGGIE